MVTSGSRVGRSRLREYIRIWVDVISYAVALTVLLTLFAMILGISTGGGFVRGKQLLFVFAWIVMAYATFKLWPRKEEAIPESMGGEATNDTSMNPEQRSWFQRRVQLMPPTRWIGEPHPSRRVSIEAKLFLASILMFAVSFILEVSFDIT